MSGDTLAWAAAAPGGSAANTLYNAIVTGALNVRNANGESVTYQSASQMLAILSGLRAASIPAASRSRSTIARVGES